MDAPESHVHSCEDVLKLLTDLNNDLEHMLEQMEKVSVDTTWRAYEMVAERSNTALAQKVKRLNEAFQKCLDEVEKNWKSMLEESKKAL